MVEEFPILTMHQFELGCQFFDVTALQKVVKPETLMFEITFTAY